MRIDFKRLEVEVQSRLWYLYWAPIMKELQELKARSEIEYEALKEEVYDFFEKMLELDKIYLGNEIGIWDDERKPIDQAIIHHTSNAAWISLERLSAIELARIYASTYAFPAKADEAKMVGQPISSGHMHDGKQVFWAYHYLVRPDATYISLLRPSETGWHAGNWSANCRSIAICLDGDYEHDRPSDRMLLTTAKLIARHNIQAEGVKGHCEVRIGKTTCPSRLFLSEEGRRGWKEDLLRMVA